MPTKENKVVEILGKKFEVVKTDNGSCDGCYFYTRHKELYLGWKHTEINRTKIKFIRYKIYGR